MNPRTDIDFCTQQGQLRFFTFVKNRIEQGAQILKPAPRQEALDMLTYAIDAGADRAAIDFLASKEAAVMPGVTLWQTIARFNKGQGYADDIVDACYLTPVSGCTGPRDGVGWVQAVVGLATMVAPLVKNLIGSKPKGALFNWSDDEKRKYINEALKEAFLGNYPCEASPHAVFNEIMKPALANDFKNSDPDRFMQKHWMGTEDNPATTWYKNAENAYGINFNDRSKTNTGASRKCASANNSGTNVNTAGMGWLGYLLIGGMAVTALGAIIYKKRKTQQNG